MSLTKKVYLTISGYDIKLSDNLTFYQKDQLKLIFYINEYGIDYENNATTRALMPVNPLNAILFIENPDGVDSVSSARIEDNAVTFYLDSTHTQYVGVSRMQLRLFDQDGCAITLPHFTFEIRENIYGSGDVRFQNVVMVDQTGTVILTEDNDMLDVGDVLTMGTEVAYPQVTKTIKELPIKHGLDGTEKLIVEDNEATKQAPLGTIVDEIKQNSQEKIREIESELAQTNAQLSEVKQKFMVIRERKVGEMDDTQAIKDSIALCGSGGWLIANRNIELSEKITLNNINLDGGNFEFSPSINGLGYHFDVTGDCEIKGVKFDSKLRGRGFARFTNANCIKISDCYFTGYSKEYGYYKTDSALLIDENILNVQIENCIFHNFGNQYGTASEDLNRCITLNNDSVINVTINNCTFSSVNQAIVSVCQTLSVTNCLFEDVKDNGLYNFSKEKCTVSNCSFIDMKDEPIVSNTSWLSVTDCYFKNWSNKAIALCGDSTGLFVKGNYFSTNDDCNFIFTRNRNYHTKKIIVEGNVYESLFESVNENSYFDFGDTVDIRFIGNNVKVTHTSSNKRFIYCVATLATVTNNSFTAVCLSSGTNVFENAKSDKTNIIQFNHLSNCRIRLAGNQLATIQGNVPYEEKSNGNQILYCSAKPQYTAFKKGDVVYKTSVETDVKNSDFMGWYSNGTELEIMPCKPIVLEHSPNNNKRPRYLGDMCIDSVTGDVYIATVMAMNGWSKIQKV